MTRRHEPKDGSVVKVTRCVAGHGLRSLGLALALVGLFAGTARAQSPGVVACPDGQAIQGLNFVTRKLICVSVEAATPPAVRVTHQYHQYVPYGAVWTTLSFDTQFLDTADLHSPTADNSRLTAPVAGLYLIHVNIVWGTGSYQGSATPYFLFLRKNGTSLIARDIQWRATDEGDQNHHLTTFAKLSAGDFVEVVLSHGRGDNSIVMPSSNLGFEHSPEFSMVWVAPD